jgi:hypothetical protein
MMNLWEVDCQPDDYEIEWTLVEVAKITAKRVYTRPERHYYDNTVHPYFDLKTLERDGFAWYRGHVSGLPPINKLIYTDAGKATEEARPKKKS